MKTFADLFTNRQLTALMTFSDLIPEIQSQVIEDGGSKDYADALAVYLAFLVDKLLIRNSSIDDEVNRHNALEKFPLNKVIVSTDPP